MRNRKTPKKKINKKETKFWTSFGKLTSLHFWHKKIKKTMLEDAYLLVIILERNKKKNSEKSH